VSGAFTGGGVSLFLEALSIEKGKRSSPGLHLSRDPHGAKMLGYRPVFCDVDPATFTQARRHFEARMTTRRAFVATHLFGSHVR